MEAIRTVFNSICDSIFNQRYPDPIYEQLRWVILLGALFAILLPWLCGYRLGEKVPYSKKRHLMFSLIFLALLYIHPIIFNHHEDSFGTALLRFLYFPPLFLFGVLMHCFDNIMNIVPISLFLLFLPAYIVALFYLLLKFDRKFVPRDRETTEPEEKQE